MAGRVVLFHPGTQHSWQVALALAELGELDRFHTSLFHQPGRWPYRAARWLPGPLRRRAEREFARLGHPALDPALVHTAGLAEWAERLARRAGARGLADRLDGWGNRRFGQALVRRLAGRPAGVLWGFNGSSLEAFRSGRARGWACVLERTIGDWRAHNAVLAAAARRYPDWFLPGWQVPDAVIARDAAEQALADHILVGSPQAAASVQAFAPPAVAARVEVLRYPYDQHLFAADMPPAPRPPGAPLRLLFLGQAGPRKGIHLLLRAMARLPAGAATLTVAGGCWVPAATWRAHRHLFTHLPTVPRAAVPTLLRRHDLLVCPSLFEGSALVLPEALAAGTGVIQTAAAGLGVTPASGLLLPEPDEDALLAALLTAIDDPAQVASWRLAAPAAAQPHRFARYRAGIGSLLARLETPSARG